MRAAIPIERVERFMLLLRSRGALGVRAIRPASPDQGSSTMQHGTCNELALLTRTAATRRAAIHGTARLAAGAALAVFPAGRWVQSAWAQEDSVILIAGSGAQVSASPGAAAARGTAAEAVAARGAARVQAAAALAEADS